MAQAADPAMPAYDPPMHGRHGKSPGMVGGSGTAADQGYMRAMQGMQHATMGMKPSGNPDCDFVARQEFNFFDGIR